MFNLRMKKISIIAGAVASAITLSTFGGFATGLPTESLAEQSIGVSSSAAGPTDGQKGNESVNSPKDFANKEITKGSVIRLNAPGDYRFIGAEAASASDNRDPNAIIVNTNNAIWIGGSGKYNIILDNVNIDIHNKDLFGFCTPIRISGNAEVNLTLVGKNYLKNHLDGADGLFVGSSLTITGQDEEASLDVYGGCNGIYSKNITINSGNIKVASDGSSAIYSNKMTLNGGNIEITGSGGSAIYSNKTTINGGKIEVSKVDGDAICGKNIIINGGDIQVNSDKGNAIWGNEITISGGTTKAISNSDWAINCNKLTIHGTNDPVLDSMLIQAIGPDGKGIHFKEGILDRYNPYGLNIKAKKCLLNGVDVMEYADNNGDVNLTMEYNK